MADKNHVTVCLVFFLSLTRSESFHSCIVVTSFEWVTWPIDFWILIKPHGTISQMHWRQQENKFSSSPPSSNNSTLLVENGDRGEKGAIKIADCQRKRKRLGWTRKHARHVKALGPFVLILSNADFLWVAEVAKSASVCLCVVCICVCQCIQYVCVGECLDCLSTREVKPGWHLLHCVCC